MFLGNTDISHPANIYLFQVNNKNTKKIFSKSTKQLKHQNDVNDFVLVSLLLTLNLFHTLFWCFYDRL